MTNTNPSEKEFLFTNQMVGDIGEKDVVAKIKCPNCANNLMLLPPNYPLCDIQCSGCLFRAQVKTNRCKPQTKIRGAGWDILDKTLRSGYLMPPLITNYVWKEGNEEKQEIRLYPFITKTSLIVRTANIKSHHRKHKMFDYNLKHLPFIQLYPK